MASNTMLFVQLIMDLLLHLRKYELLEDDPPNEGDYKKIEDNGEQKLSKNMGWVKCDCGKLVPKTPSLVNVDMKKGQEKVNENHYL